MPARQFLAIMVLFLAGTLSTASAKPPDLPVDTNVDCLAQEPETPIDLTVELWRPSASESLGMTFGWCEGMLLNGLQGKLIDVVCPPLRLRHLPGVMACPYVKAWSDRVERLLEDCFAAALTGDKPQGDEEECEEPSCPYSGGNGRCPITSKSGKVETEKDSDTEAEVLDVMPVEDPEPISVMPKEEVVPQPETAPPIPSPAAPTDVETDVPEPETAAPKASAVAPSEADSAPPTCPYLRERACPPHAANTAAECPGTPLENLERLEKAAHIYHKAEHCRATGQLESACRLYEEAKCACPGSRIADLACKRLEELYALKAVQNPSPVVKEAEAWRIYHKAETCRVAGKIERACRLYERAKNVCPGSRIEDLSCRRLVELYARKAIQDAPSATEEAEPLPCHEPNTSYGRLKAECTAVSDELRSKAAQLLDQGHYVEACVLADTAYHFTAECENVFSLLTKAHEILEAPKTPTEQKTEKPIEPGGNVADEATPAEEPAETPDVPPTSPEAFVQPPFPPVDPAVVDALEKVLREVGDPTIPKLIIQVDQPAAEEQEDPVSSWPYGPQQTEVPPSLLADPTDDDAADDSAGEAVDSPQDLARAAVADHLEEMLRHAVTTLEQRLGAEVDLDRPGAPSGRVNLQIGNVNCSVLCDGWGHRYIIVGLTPAATGDLRAVQQDHIGRVLHWVEVMNSGGNSLPNDDAAAGDDDADDDDLMYYDDPTPVY